MTLPRRDFLKLSAGAFAGSMASPAFGMRIPSTRSKKRLVVVVLRGGLDGYSVAVPRLDPTYAAKRLAGGNPIGYTASELANLDANWAIPTQFNDSLFAAWNTGKMAMVQDVGMPTPNFSHFTSQKKWASMFDDDPPTSGWLGRLANAEGWDASGNVGVSSNFLLEFRGEPMQLPPVPIILDSIADFGPPTNVRLSSNASDERNQAFLNLEAAVSSSNETTQAYSDTQLDAEAYRLILESVENNYAGFGNYLDSAGEVTKFGANMREIAKMIQGDALNPSFAPNVYVTVTGGFDTHSGQRLALDERFDSLNSGLRGFMEDMGILPNSGGLQQYFGDDVVVMLVTEFGRRLEQNLSGGSDHGYGNMMTLLGAVNGGSYSDGQDQGILREDLMSPGNRAMEIDTRAVVRTVLRDHMGISQASLDAVFTETFDDFGFTNGIV